MAAPDRQIAGMQSRSFAPGEVIFRQGDAGKQEAYLVHEGKVEVRRRTAKGDLLGEVAFYSHGPHSATALAVGRVTLIVVPADRLEHLVRTKPDLGIAIIRRLARMAATEDDRPAGRAGPVA